jgi:hypothetical protein
VIPALTSAYSVPALMGELLGWFLGAVAHLPGRGRDLASEAREVATGWGIPVAEVTDLYAAFPARLALAVAAVALVTATAAVVHGLRERRRARGLAR